VGIVRQAAGNRWVDTQLTEWPDNDFRIFVGNLGPEVSDAMLTQAFNKYGSFQMARVIRGGPTNKTKGYGFVSLGDIQEGARAVREMHNQYIGNRPCQLKRSAVEARTVTNHKGRAKKRVVEAKATTQERPRNRPHRLDQTEAGGVPGFNKRY